MRYVISSTQPRLLLIKLCRENLFRISNLIKSNRQNKLKLGVGFKAKAGLQLILLNWGGDVGVFRGWGLCEGVGIYLYIVGVC